MSYTATISGIHLKLDFGSDNVVYFPADQITLSPAYDPDFYFLNGVSYNWTDCTSFGVVANRDSFFAQVNAILPVSGGGILSSDVTATLTVTSDLTAELADINTLNAGVANIITGDIETLTAHTFTVSDFVTNTIDVSTKIDFPNADATQSGNPACIRAINQSFGSDTMIALNDCDGSWVAKGSKVVGNSIALAVGSNRPTNDTFFGGPAPATAIGIGNLNNRFLTGGLAGIDSRTSDGAPFSGGVSLFAKVNGAGVAGLFGDGADVELDNCQSFIFCDGLNSTIENFYPTTFTTDISVGGNANVTGQINATGQINGGNIVGTDIYFSRLIQGADDSGLAGVALELESSMASGDVKRFTIGRNTINNGDNFIFAYEYNSVEANRECRLGLYGLPAMKFQTTRTLFEGLPVRINNDLTATGNIILGTNGDATTFLERQTFVDEGARTTNLVLVASQVTSRQYLDIEANSAIDVTFPSRASITTALGFTPAAGDMISECITIYNSGSSTITLVSGTDATVRGKTSVASGEICKVTARWRSSTAIDFLST